MNEFIADSGQGSSFVSLEKPKKEGEMYILKKMQECLQNAMRSPKYLS